jgi:hypothetical protein
MLSKPLQEDATTTKKPACQKYLDSLANKTTKVNILPKAMIPQNL